MRAFLTILLYNQSCQGFGNRKGVFLMSHHIISISRQFGSGGHEISEKLAQKLGLPFYDKELITRAARESGLSVDTLEASDERYDSATPQDERKTYFGLSNSDTLFVAQAKIIRKIAYQEDCIIIGRCSDVILLDEDVDLLRVFIHAPLQDRIQRIRRIHSCSVQDAQLMIRKSDQERRKYYSCYTEKAWGAQENYDVSLSSAYWGIDRCVNLLADTAALL